MFLQFLNGGRDQQVEELNQAATLVIGSGPDDHIRVVEPGVEAAHCQIYPAEGRFWLQDRGVGNTILHMRRLKGTTEGLKQGDIFILGQTFVKFSTERPVAGGAAPAASDGGGAAVAALEAKLKAAQAAETTLATTKAELEQARSAAQAAQDEASRAQGDIERERAGREEAEQQREALAREKDDLSRRVKDLEGQVESAKTEAEAQVAAAKTEAEAQVAAAKTEAEAQAAAAKTEAEAELARGREALEREQAEATSALEATRAELEVLRAERAAAGRDRLAALTTGADLGALLDALALPDAVRARLEAAVEDAATREALRRVAGPVVPLRGLRVPGCDRDLEAELGAARRQDAQAAAARALGLHTLEASQLEQLLEAARA